MILPCPQICPYPVNVFVLLRGTCLLCTNMAHKLRTGSYICPSPRDSLTLYVGVHSLCVHCRYDIPPFWLLRTSQLPFNYPRNTVQRFRGYYSRNSADAFHDSDWADAFKQICRFPLTIRHDSLWHFRGNPSEIPQKICADSAVDLQKTHEKL